MSWLRRGGGVFAEEEGVLAEEGGGSSLGYLFAMLGFLSHKKQGKNINYLHSQLSTSIQTIFHFICRIFAIYFFQFNFVGRILGPRGLTAKQLEQETGCKVMVRGKGSMRDKKKVIHPSLVINSSFF